MIYQTDIISYLGLSCWGQAGKPHPQDPQNPRKRIYKVFSCIKDSRTEETSMGTGVVGKSRVPNNKAHRDALLGAVTTKVSSVPADFSDLFGAPKDEKPKTKKEPKKLSAEEQEKKDFEKEMQMNLVSKSLFISIDRMFLTTSWLQLVLCPSVSMSFLGCLSVPHHLLETSFH